MQSGTKSTVLHSCSLCTAESLTTNWVIVQSIISFLHPSRSERATAGINSLIGETRSSWRTIRENSGINWVWLRAPFNGTQLFFTWHNESSVALGDWALVGASVMWVCPLDRHRLWLLYSEKTRAVCLISIKHTRITWVFSLPIGMFSFTASEITLLYRRYHCQE